MNNLPSFFEKLLLSIFSKCLYHCSFPRFFLRKMDYCSLKLIKNYSRSFFFSKEGGKSSATWDRASTTLSAKELSPSKSFKIDPKQRIQKNPQFIYSTINLQIPQNLSWLMEEMMYHPKLWGLGNELPEASFEPYLYNNKPSDIDDFYTLIFQFIRVLLYRI